MTPPDRTNDEATGLPWPRSWRGVYVFVFVCFLVWIGLLITLSVIFS